MKNKNIILIILGIIILGFIIYLASRPEKQFRIIKFTSKNYVVNRTEKSYLDTIVHIGLNELGIVGQSVLIREQKEEVDLGNGGTTDAYVINDGGQSLIYIDMNMSRSKCVEVITHELIHIEQYLSKRFVPLEYPMILWDDAIINGELVEYEKRPWEIDAYKRGFELENHLRDLLYE